GSSAPSVTYIVAQSPGGDGPDGKFYPRDSLVLVDELATCKREQPNKGSGGPCRSLAKRLSPCASAGRFTPEALPMTRYSRKRGRAVAASPTSSCAAAPISGRRRRPTGSPAGTSCAACLPTRGNRTFPASTFREAANTSG